MSKVSVIVPALNEPYLQNTIDDLYAKAAGEIEVIAVLDGYWPSEILKDHGTLVIIHSTERRGMRASINEAARIAKGDYLMKVDAHCAFSPAYDEKLKESCKHRWTVVPARYRLDVNTWDRIPEKVYEFQYIRNGDLKGKDWPEYAQRVKGEKIADLMTMQGSCWFMHRTRFWGLGGLDEENYGTMGREAQEIGLKTWLSGGRLVLNREVWYAHWAKPKEWVIAAKKEKEKSTQFAVDFWMNNKGQYRRDMAWLVNHFAPVPTWEGKKSTVSNAQYLHATYNPNDLSSPVKIKGFKRGTLAKLFKVLGYQKGAEVGVRKGDYSENICRVNPKVELLCVDPWFKYEGNPRSPSPEKHNRHFQAACEKLAPYNATLIKRLSMDAVRDVPEESLDFVYIDGNHVFDYVMQDIIEWAKRVRPGGIVSGHDYFVFRRDGGVLEAVNAYVGAHDIKEVFITDDKHSSFFWVKE